MIKLSERLKTIADFIEIGESVADIGTDHGFLPIYLWENNISPKLILSDINQGPLDKANENIAVYNLKSKVKINTKVANFDLRKGSGMETVDYGEVDDIVIAGMGGKLIIDIMNFDLEKSKSFNKFILQPRTAPEKLREWLLDSGFKIADEILVREGKYIWEIIMAKPICGEEKDFKKESYGYEISPILVKKKDPLLKEFLERKLAIIARIIEGIKKVDYNEKNKIDNTYQLKLNELEDKIEYLRRVKEEL